MRPSIVFVMVHYMLALMGLSTLANPETDFTRNGHDFEEFAI